MTPMAFVSRDPGVTGRVSMGLAAMGAADEEVSEFMRSHCAAS